MPKFQWHVINNRFAGLFHIILHSVTFDMDNNDLCKHLLKNSSSRQLRKRVFYELFASFRNPNPNLVFYELLNRMNPNATSTRGTVYIVKETIIGTLLGGKCWRRDSVEMSQQEKENIFDADFEYPLFSMKDLYKRFEIRAIFMKVTDRHHWRCVCYFEFMKMLNVL